MLTYLSFLSVFFTYAFVRILTKNSKNSFDKNQILSMLFYLFIIGLLIHYDRYPNMQIQAIIMALCYPFMGYLAFRVNK